LDEEEPVEPQASVDDRLPKIVVGVDGSPEAEAALRWAVGEAVLRRGVLHLVASSWHAVWVRYLMLPLTELSGSTSAILSVAASQARGLAPDLPLSEESVEEPPATALVEASEGATLLVVARSSRGSPTRLPDFVARYCSRYAPCPVVVVPCVHG
jgi:nucleotide-binding universal stress UspA family protein